MAPSNTTELRWIANLSTSWFANRLTLCGYNFQKKPRVQRNFETEPPWKQDTGEKKLILRFRLTSAPDKQPFSRPGGVEKGKKELSGGPNLESPATTPPRESRLDDAFSATALLSTRLLFPPSFIPPFSGRGACKCTYHTYSACTSFWELINAFKMGTWPLWPSRKRLYRRKSKARGVAGGGWQKDAWNLWRTLHAALWPWRARSERARLLKILMTDADSLIKLCLVTIADAFRRFSL